VAVVDRSFEQWKNGSSPIIGRLRSRISCLCPEEASLLSGTKKSEHAPDAKGGLLKEIGEFGIVIFKDFTSILSMNRDSRQTVLAALREIYDGYWTRCVGSDGGKSLRWKGKIGLIAGCTPVIDSHHAVISTMGERFTYYRLPVADSQDAAEQARRAINNVSHVSEMRDQLSTAVKEIFGQFNFNELPSRVESHEQDRLINLAMLACRARSPVERDPIERHVLFTPQPEAPARLAAVLTRLFCGLRTIGVKDELAWKVITKVGFDCVPSPRRELFQGLANKAENSLSTQSLMAIARCSKTATRRALEELELLGILENVPGVTSKSPDYWALSQQALLCIRVLGEPASQQTVEQAATTNAA